MKRIGILETGSTPSTLRERFGTYVEMFEHLLGPGAADYRAYDVRVGTYPDQPEDCDAYIVTGSAAGAYDPDPWIADLIGFLRQAKGRAGSHQDQVVELPPGAAVLASSIFTPFAMLEYSDQPAISIQPHPEFEPDYAKALIVGRRGIHFSEAEADAAIASLDAPNDNARLARWITDFLARPK